MQSNFIARRLSAFVSFLILISFVFNAVALAQSKTQKPEKSTGTGKKNERPTPQTEEERKKEEEARRQAEEDKNAVVDDEPLKIKTNIVNVDAVVFDKKTKQIVVGLKKENFAVFENGVKQEISSFSMPDAPITVTLVVEYSKWTERFGYLANRGMENGTNEVIRPVAYFLSRFIKPPGDYASVIAFDMRPTPITDFTNDPTRLSQTVDLLLRNNPAFSENNLFDAVKFALVGGKGDAVVLENTKEKTAVYGGMVDVTAKRRAIILVASGIDTFSKTNYDAVRKIIQNSGIPIYIIGTGNLFFKMYENQLPATDGLDGSPGRMTFLQAQNTLRTFATESGGAHFPVTFAGEVPSVLQNINALLRNQYSIAYDIGDVPREAGKKYKLEVKVDINGDGIYEDKQFTVQHRPFYTTPKDDKK
jgi:Ca-activated chloride channel homolog